MLLKYSAAIKDVSYVTQNLEAQMYKHIYTEEDKDFSLQVTSLAGFGTSTAVPYGINPSAYFDESFVLEYVSDTGLGLSETLYTARGS